MLPLLFMVTLGLVQVGLFVRDQLILVEAARAGAREAAVTGVETDVRAAVDRAASALDPKDISMHITRGSGSGSPVTVELIYTGHLSIPWVNWLFPHITSLKATATMRQEFG